MRNLSIFWTYYRHVYAVLTSLTVKNFFDITHSEFLREFSNSGLAARPRTGPSSPGRPRFFSRPRGAAPGATRRGCEPCEELRRARGVYLSPDVTIA